MTKKYYKKGRKIYNVEEIVEKKTRNTTKGAKPKVKDNPGSELGSGMFSYQNGSNMLKKIKRLPDIGRLEKDVLQCIIGQDKQVRQIITAIYRAINFKSIKSNVLISSNPNI